MGAPGFAGLARSMFGLGSSSRLGGLFTADAFLEQSGRSNRYRLVIG